MPGKKKFSTDKVLAAIKDTGGLKTEICERLKCARPTLDSYIKGDERIAQAYEDECNAVSDMARGALFEAIQSRQPWAVMFYLDRKDPEYSRNKKDTLDNDADAPSLVRHIVTIEDMSGGTKSKNQA